MCELSSDSTSVRSGTSFDKLGGGEIPPTPHLGKCLLNATCIHTSATIMCYRPLA